MRRVFRIARQARAEAWLAAVVVACVFAGGSERRTLSSDDPRQVAEVVRISATATVPDAVGDSVVTVVLTVAADWHIFANPVGVDNLVDAQTTLKFSRTDGVLDADVDYPPGVLSSAPDYEGVRLYEGRVVIPAKVKRAAVKGPLKVSVKLQACNDKKKKCIPGTIVVNVP